MSEQKHTPGPWYTDGGACGVFHDGGTSRIATIEGNFTSVRIANARLIAAAPELLEALKRIGDPEFRYASDDDEDTQLSMRIADARAAIAKATGR